jgi:hypothetical protein
MNEIEVSPLDFEEDQDHLASLFVLRHYRNFSDKGGRYLYTDPQVFDLATLYLPEYLDYCTGNFYRLVREKWSKLMSI